jgi:hypothetical protein
MRRWEDEVMSFSQLFLTALSLAAAGSGTFAIDRVMEGLSSAPAAEADSEQARRYDDETDNRLNY